MAKYGSYPCFINKYSREVYPSIDRRQQVIAYNVKIPYPNHLKS